MACSRWNEPLGRTSLEASSRGCAVIISDRGGLPETITHAIILKKLTVNSDYESINSLNISDIIGSTLSSSSTLFFTACALSDL